MYIGPWQEYRLAKLQDDAVQKLQEQWQLQLHEKLVESGDPRLRELMEQLPLTLPALDPNKVHKKRPKPRPPICSRSSHRDEEGHSHKQTSSNQESHEIPDNHDHAGSASQRNSYVNYKKPKRKTKSKSKDKPSFAKEMEKRKKKFANWLKQPPSDSSTSNEEITTVESSDIGSTTKLPRINYNGINVPPENGHVLVEQQEATILPPLYNLSIAEGCTDGVGASDMERQDVTDENEEEEVDLEASLDEDAVNDLLNWTDNLESFDAG